CPPAMVPSARTVRVGAHLRGAMADPDCRRIRIHLIEMESLYAESSSNLVVVVPRVCSDASGSFFLLRREGQGGRIIGGERFERQGGARSIGFRAIPGSSQDR